MLQFHYLGIMHRGFSIIIQYINFDINVHLFSQLLIFHLGQRSFEQIDARMDLLHIRSHCLDAFDQLVYRCGHIRRV